MSFLQSFAPLYKAKHFANQNLLRVSRSEPVTVEPFCNLIGGLNLWLTRHWPVRWNEGKNQAKICTSKLKLRCKCGTLSLGFKHSFLLSICKQTLRKYVVTWLYVFLQTQNLFLQSHIPYKHMHEVEIINNFILQGYKLNSQLQSLIYRY